MKVYSIGREAGCDIVISDSTDVVSRRHAVLNVYPSGKMTIVDQSHNGTYVNGIRISQNVPVPVTRQDNISFAHVARLDWSLVPDSRAWIKYALIALVAVLVIAAGIWGFSAMNNKAPEPDPNAPVQLDSATIKKNEEKLKEQEKQREDSIKKHVNDSIAAAEKAKEAKDGKKKKDDKKKDDKKKADEKKADDKKAAPADTVATKKKRANV